MTKSLYRFSIAEEVGLSISRHDSNSCLKTNRPNRRMLVRVRGIFHSHSFIKIISFFSPLDLAEFPLHLQMKRMGSRLPREA